MRELFLEIRRSAINSERLHAIAADRQRRADSARARGLVHLADHYLTESVLARHEADRAEEREETWCAKARARAGY